MSGRNTRNIKMRERRRSSAGLPEGPTIKRPTLSLRLPVREPGSDPTKARDISDIVDATRQKRWDAEGEANFQEEIRIAQLHKDIQEKIQKYRLYFGYDKRDEELYNNFLQGANYFADRPQTIGDTYNEDKYFNTWKLKKQQQGVDTSKFYITMPEFQDAYTEKKQQDAELDRLDTANRIAHRAEQKRLQLEEKARKEQARIEQSPEFRRQMAEECTTDSCNIMGGRKMTKKRRNQFRKKSKKTKTKRHRRLRFRRPVSYHR
jgi:hypothetical protein